MNLIKKLIVSFIVLLAFYVGSLTAVFCLPDNAIQNNVLNSLDDVVVLESAGYRFKRNAKIICDGPASYVDALTDGVMLTRNLNYNIVNNDKAEVFQKFFKFDVDFPEEYYSSPILRALNMNGYGRYWHGYDIVLRPLLIFFDYAKIRLICVGVFVVLVSILAYLTYKVLGLGITLAFAVALTLCKFPIIASCMQFMNMTVLTMLSIIILLGYWLPKEKDNIKNDKLDNLYIFIFILASLTIFFDLLTTPILPTGLAMLVIMEYMHQKENYCFNILSLLSGVFVWCLGCISCWIAKWCLNAVFFNSAILNEAYNQIFLRVNAPITMNDGAVMEVSAIYSVIVNLAMLVQPLEFIWFISIFLFLLLAVVYLKFKLPKVNTDKYYSKLMLLFMISPIIWYLLIKNHSLIHFWYTYRSLMISVVALWLYLKEVIDFRKITIGCKEQ